MSLILVVGPAESVSDTVRIGLEAEGWQVRVVPNAAQAAAVASDRAPDLVLLDTTIAEVSEVAAKYARAGGGPGVLALVPTGERAPSGVDASVDAPFEEQKLRVAVRRCLSKGQREAAAAAAEKARSSGHQLTSDELFGDVLAEVEELTSRARRPTKERPVAEEVDRRLEDTLSGVIELPKKAPASTKPKRSSSDDVDDLLNQTLSGLGVSSRKKSKAAPTASPPPDPLATQRLEPIRQEPPPAAAAPVEVSEPSSTEAEAVEVQESVEVVEVVEAVEPPPVQEPTPEPPAAPVVEPEPKSEPVRSPAGTASRPAPVAEAASESKPRDSTSSPSAATPPSFGQYTLLEKIAVGGMAEVWKARMKGVEGFQKNVAIKKILSHLTDSVDFVTMFIDEAKLAAQLNHPNIIHIYDLGKIEDDYFIAMEYVEGKDLRTMLNAVRKKDRRMDVGLSLLVAARLASALDHAHRKRDFDDRELGLVHRDVSPQNVLISFEGDIKLCDFGIVKAVAKASKTQMGALKGKLQYMSPEQAWGRVVDSRSDIFSLGAVLFEMLTGRRLFAGDSEISVLESVRDCKIQTPRQVDEGISEEIEAIVVKALAKDPDDRYQSAAEMQKDLEKALYAMEPTPGPAELAALLEELFEAETRVKAAAAAVSGTSSRTASAAGADVPAVAPKAGAPVDDEAKGGRAWIGIAVAVVVVAGALGAWFFGGDKAPAPTEPAVAEAVPPTATVPAAESPGESTSEAGETTPDEAAGPSVEGEPADDGAVGDEAPAPEADDSSSSSPGDTEPAEDLDLQAMVEAQVLERTRALEAEKQRLEAEIAATEPQESTEDDASTPTDEGTADEDPVSAGSEPADELPAPATDAATEEPGAQEPPDVPAVEPVETAPLAEPTPAEVVPEPEPEPEPRVQRGQIVELSTPGLRPPKLQTVEPPVYPPIAKRLRVEGTVVVAVLVDENGDVADTRLIRGVQQNVGLNEAAVDAAKTGKFEAATLDGVEVKVWYNLSIPFRL